MTIDGGSSDNRSGFIRTHQLWAFFALTLGVSALIMGLSAATGVEAISILVPLSPSLIAITLTALLSGKKGLRALLGDQLKFRLPLLWYTVGLLMIPLLALTAIAGRALFEGGAIQLRSTGLLPDVIVIVLIALGEEFGWRAYALPRLQARYPALVASLILGTVWSLWHFPGYLAGIGVPLEMPYFIFVRWVFGVTILMTWVYNQTESVVMPILMHASANLAFNYLPLLPEWTGEINTFWVFLGILWFTVAIVIVSTGPRRLGQPAGQRSARA